MTRLTLTAILTGAAYVLGYRTARLWLGRCDSRCRRGASNGAGSVSVDPRAVSGREMGARRLEVHRMPLADLLAQWRPGSGDWDWDAEEIDLLTAPCMCPASPDGSPGPTPCDTPGHYQLRLEEHLRRVGRIEQPVCLGPDGRVWDGHHRIVAARRLGFPDVPVEAP